MLQPPLCSTLHCSLFCCLLLPPFNNLQHPYLLFLSALLIVTELQHGRWVNRASGTMLNQVTEGLTVRLALPVVPRLSDIQILCIYLFPILPTGLLLSLHACHNKIFFPCIPSSVCMNVNACVFVFEHAGIGLQAIQRALMWRDKLRDQAFGHWLRDRRETK